MASIYGEVGQNPRFVEAFTLSLSRISDAGVEKAMLEYIAKAKVDSSI
jgi:hypothetical protein